MRHAVCSGLHCWGSPIQVSSHYAARALAQAGWRTAYLSSPVTPLHLLKGRRDALPARWAMWRSGGVLDEAGMLWGYVPFALLAPDNRPGLRSRFLVRHWPALTAPNLGRKLAAQGFDRPDLLYLDNFYHAGLAARVRPRRTVYHMADVYAGFPGYSRGFARAERELVRSADLVLYPSLAMRPLVEGLGPKDMRFLPNGIENSRFSGPLPPLPPEYLSIPAPRAVYVGAMDVWFDFTLLAQAARGNPGVSFVLVGPGELARRRLPQLENLHILGPRGRGAMPAYLRHAQVGLIPFAAAKYATLLDPVRPLKLLEYLACGLPVVSMAWAELRAMDSPAILCDNSEDFCAAVAESAQDPGDGEAARDYARSMDWGGLLQQFIDAVS